MLWAALAALTRHRGAVAQPAAGGAAGGRQLLRRVRWRSSTPTSLAALGIAALLALGTAARFYLVTRLGERVIADIRRAIYDRVIGMSPGFYERIMTGEVLSRLTTDTTLVLSVIGSSVSVALRNVLTLIGGLVLLFCHQPEADRAGARRRAAGAWCRSSTLGRRLRGAVAREPGPDRRVERRRRPRACSRRRRCRPTPTRRRAARAFGGADRARLRRGAAADRDARGADGDRDLPRLRLDRRRCSGSARATCARAR